MDPLNKDNNNPAEPQTSQPVNPESVAPVAPAAPPIISVISTSPENTPPPAVTQPPVEQSTQTATPPSNPTVATTAPVQTGHVEKSNKLLYLFIAGLLVILVALMGLFFFNRISSATAAENEIVIPTTEPAATPTIIVPTYASEDEKEVMGVEVGAVDSQLKIIEDDANKL